MSRKRKLLNCLTREYLKEIATDYEIAGISQLNNDDLVSTLSSKRSIHIKDILEDCSRDDLKTICQSMG